MEDERIVSFNTVKLKCKWKQVKRKAKAEASTLFNWCRENPVQAAGIASAASLSVSKVMRYKKVTKEEDRRRTEYYDPRTGKYARARRPLKPREQLEAERRYKAGEGWTHILADMGLLR